jgi:hypothetical protein
MYLLDPTIINNRSDIIQTVKEHSLEMENTRRKTGMVYICDQNVMRK